MRSWQGVGKADTRLRKFELNLQLHAKPVKIKVGSWEQRFVTRELNNNLTKEQRKQSIVTKAIGDYVYTVINHEFDNYTIIDKKPIVAEYDKLRKSRKKK